MRKDKKESASRRSPRTRDADEKRRESRRPSDAATRGTGRRIWPIVGPGQEHGVPYPGDIPNPLAGKYRGCF